MTKEKQKLRETLRKLFALLGSPNKNEADSARQKIDDLAAKHKMSWNDVIELVGIGGNGKKDTSSDADGAESAFDAFMDVGNQNQFMILIGIALEAGLFRSPTA
jgi:hypothetical protein